VANAAHIGKPDFVTVVGGQTSSGYWLAESRSVLAAFIDGEVMDD